MKYDLDVHTHTIASGHAYTTLLENIKQASEIGIKVLGISDHGPSMPGGPHLFYFANMRVLPRELYGVTLLHGCEVNVVDYDGNLDMPEELVMNTNSEKLISFLKNKGKLKDLTLD